MKSHKIASRGFVSALICTSMLSSVPALAADRDKAVSTPPAIYTDLVACKNISDADQRLACYDEKVTALESAQSNNQVVIADREQVREARRGLFGLSLPRIRLFSGDGDEGDQVNQIEGKIASARKGSGSKWILKLEDGAVWQQTAAPRSTSRRPKVGDSIVIERGSLGSFVAKVNDGRAFKVKRIVN